MSAEVSAELTPTMEHTLLVLCAVTKNEGGARWTGVSGLSTHKGSIYALDRRGLIIWNAYRQRAKVTRDGWDVAEALL